ncbi:hypothetical protein M9H77_13841 [Catharanthus roseus]|uniref:Uncharacterized protein n=1 Tax=Catharanthus roseus TaxID=4058 RepID=A0ACC0BLB2_CATRO|nr:hypothetical protein M9H77_13841 [Catharanthus roseus]
MLILAKLGYSVSYGYYEHRRERGGLLTVRCNMIELQCRSQLVGSSDLEIEDEILDNNDSSSENERELEKSNKAKYQSRCSVYAVKDIIGPLNKNQQYTVIKLGFGNLIRRFSPVIVKVKLICKGDIPRIADGDQKKMNARVRELRNLGC